MRALAAGVVAVACYSPNPAKAPCSENGTCPGAQVCDFRQSPPTCGDELVDANGPIIDAPPPCAVSTDCPQSAPYCDLGKCRGCRADTECTPGVCSESTGKCVAQSATIYVSPTGSDLGNCEEMSPCLTIPFAVTKATATRDHIRLAKGTYTGNFKLESDIPITLSSESDDPAGVTLSSTSLGGILQIEQASAVVEALTLSSNGQADGIVVRNGRSATIYKLRIASTRQGITMSGNNIATLTVTGTMIVDGSDVGIDVQDATAVIVDSYVRKNRNSGLRTNRVALTLINTMIVQNGQTTSGNPGVRLQNIGMRPQRFELNTIAGNLSASSPAGVACDGSVGISSSILADNGVLGATQMSIQCGADHTLFSFGAPNGMGNKTGAAAFIDPASGDFHIGPTSEARGRASSALMTTSDIDGEPRPQGDTDCGADEIP